MIYMVLIFWQTPYIDLFFFDQYARLQNTVSTETLKRTAFFVNKKMKIIDITKYYMPVVHFIKAAGLAYLRRDIWENFLKNIGDPSNTIIFAVDFYLIASWFFTSALFFILNSEKGIARLRRKLIYLFKMLYWVSMTYLYTTLKNDIGRDEYRYLGLTTSAVGVFFVCCEIISEIRNNGPGETRLESPLRRAVEFV